MKKALFLLLSIVFLASCTNDHLYFSKGVVVTHSADMVGVYLEVDTTYDGIADMDAQVVGQDMMRKFQKGDSVSVDVREGTSYARPIIERAHSD